MKVIDYQIIWSGQLSDLQDEVKELLKRGWQPQGGIFAIEQCAFYQAMVLMEGGGNQVATVQKPL